MLFTIVNKWFIDIKIDKQILTASSADNKKPQYLQQKNVLPIECPSPFVVDPLLGLSGFGLE